MLIPSPILFQIFGHNLNIIFQFYSCYLQVLIQLPRSINSLVKRKKLPKKFPWDKVKKSQLEKRSGLICKAVDGLFYKIVNLVLSLCRKFNNWLLVCKILNQQNQMKISGYGLLVNHINNSLLVCCKRSLKLQTNHQKVWKLVFIKHLLL